MLAVKILSVTVWSGADRARDWRCNLRQLEDCCEPASPIHIQPLTRMAARRSVLGAVALVSLAAWLFLGASFSGPQQEVFVVVSPVSAPALRATHQKGNAFAGVQTDVSTPVMAMKALPEPRPNDATDLPVDLNRTSLFWGLLTILILSILFSSYFFN